MTRVSSLNGLATSTSSSTTNTIPTSMDDLNLQFRMQQVGVILFGIPALLSAWMSMMDEAVQELPLVVMGGGGSDNGDGVHHNVIDGSPESHNMDHQQQQQHYGWLVYGGLILINGMAFTSYNLASTYLLSRISVVHHAALNCIRRIFAILVTSIIFQVPITLLGGLGIVVSFASFVMFSKAKAAKAATASSSKKLLPLYKDPEAAE